jgi:ABC-type lipoprotein release transport system permease subunit
MITGGEAPPVIIECNLKRGNRGMLCKILKIHFHKMKHSYVLLFSTLMICVASVAVALLFIRSQKMNDASQVLDDYGNYDIAFCEVTDELKDKLEADSRFSALGYIYDFGEMSIKQSGNMIRIGALKNKQAEDMFYVHPILGRYPKENGEICMDRIALRSSGYDEKLGQTIIISYIDASGKKLEKDFKLVGIIELQKQDEGVLYSCRSYPEKMFSVTDMEMTDYPYAYVNKEEAEEIFQLDRTHILTNVSSKENSGDVLNEYMGVENGEADTDLTENLHIDTGHYFGREWTALYIMGKTMSDDGASIADILQSSVETLDVELDVYTKYFIPVFMGLIIIVAFIGIFDAVRLSADEYREEYGILLCLGLTRKRIIKYTVIEMIILLAVGIFTGWGIGVVSYQLILGLLNKIFSLDLPSALSLDAYYRPYIVMATRNPWFYSALLACIVTVLGTSCVFIDLLRMTPVRMEQSAVHKRKRKRNIHSLYALLNRYVGAEVCGQKWMPYFLISVLMSVAVFGFLFFREKSIQDTAAMTEKIEYARINEKDYYMRQTNTVLASDMQYMHESGVTEQMYQELKENAAVDDIQGIVENTSTCLILDQDEMLSKVLLQQSAYSVDESNIRDEEAREYYKFMGVNTKKKAVFNLSTIGLRDEDIEDFADSVIRGELHEDKLQSGEEVLVVVTEESQADYFKVGDVLPLYDVTRPSELDNSVEFLMGQMPVGYRDKSKEYIVSAEGVSYTHYCYDSLVQCAPKIGAVVLVDATEDSFYFNHLTEGEVCLLTGITAFEQWGLSNKNYTSVGVRLHEESDNNAFEKVWLQVVQKAGYMESTDVFSIMREQKVKRQEVMAIFYAVVLVLVILGILCTDNSLTMRINAMREEYHILRCMGMTTVQICILLIRRYSFMGMIGMVVSMLPVLIYSCLVRYAENKIQKAVQNDTIDMLFRQEPWLEMIPKYHLVQGRFIWVVVSVGVIAICGISVIVYTRFRRGKYN